MNPQPAGSQTSPAQPAGFTPFETLEAAFRYWWLVALLTLWGGVVAWGIHLARSPVYEAWVGFTVSYDLSNMGEMTQFEEDHASGAVGDLLYASDVMDGVLADARQQGIQLDLAGLAQAVSRERRNQLWIIRIRHSDPQTAALLANLWGQRADTALRAAYVEAVKAQGLQRYLASLESCLQRSAVSEPVTAPCNLANLPAVQAELSGTGHVLAEAKLASRGILPSLVLRWSERAMVPTRPVLYGLGEMVLAGCGLGFLLAVWLVQVRLPERLARRLRRA